MSATTITLWFLRETEKARQYSKVRPQHRNYRVDFIWVPLSIIEHTTKRGDEHDVKLPDWFVEKNNL